MSGRHTGCLDVVISQPGGTMPRRVPVAAPQCSWELSAPGSFSAFVRLDDLLAAGVSGDITDYWLDVATPAGRWGGVITGKPVSGGIAEIAAIGYAALLQGSPISDGEIVMAGSPGGLARRAIAGARGGAAAFLRIGTIDEGGGALTMDVVGDVGADILPQLADAGDVDWLVDADRTFHLARRLGRDRSATVRLVEDRHLIGGRINDDVLATRAPAFRVQSGLSNAIMTYTSPRQPVADPQPPNNPPPPANQPPTLNLGAFWEIVRNDPELGAIASQWGALPEGIPTGGAAPSWQGFGALTIPHLGYTVEPPNAATPPASNAAPPPWVGVAVGIGAHQPGVPGQRHAPPRTIPLEVTVANIDDAFLIEVGDTVRIEIGSAGVSGRFRPAVKALDVAAMSLTLAGELLGDA